MIIHSRLIVTKIIITEKIVHLSSFLSKIQADVYVSSVSRLKLELLEETLARLSLKHENEVTECLTSNTTRDVGKLLRFIKQSTFFSKRILCHKI